MKSFPKSPLLLIPLFGCLAWANQTPNGYPLGTPMTGSIPPKPVTPFTGIPSNPIQSPPGASGRLAQCLQAAETARQGAQGAEQQRQTAQASANQHEANRDTATNNAATHDNNASMLHIDDQGNNPPQNTAAIQTEQNNAKAERTRASTEETARAADQRVADLFAGQRDLNLQNLQQQLNNCESIRQAEQCAGRCGGGGGGGSGGGGGGGGGDLAAAALGAAALGAAAAAMAGAMGGDDKGDDQAFQAQLEEQRRQSAEALKQQEAEIAELQAKQEAERRAAEEERRRQEEAAATLNLLEELENITKSSKNQTTVGYTEASGGPNTNQAGTGGIDLQLVRCYRAPNQPVPCGSPLAQICFNAANQQLPCR